jgi:hypothetical protein
MSSAPITREYRIYLAMWRKAFLSDDPVVVKTSSRNMAIAMRQGMYRAIRPYRNGQQIDDQLQKASEKFVVYLNDDTLELRPRLTLAELDTLFDQIGIDEEDLLMPDERLVADELKEFLEERGVRPATPFYKREG